MAAFIAPLISGIAGLFGGGKQQQQQGSFDNKQSQTSSGEQTQSSGGTSTSTPNLSPLQQQLMSLFGQGATNLYNQSQDLSGYRAQGLQNINDSSDAASQAIKARLAARGLSYSPAAGNADISQEINRGNQQSSFLSNLPMLATQLKQNAMQGLIQAFGAMPTAMTQTSSGTSTGSFSGQQSGESSGTQKGTVSGNPTAGFLSGLGSGLFAPSGPGQGTNLSSILKMFGGGNPDGDGTTGG